MKLPELEIRDRWVARRDELRALRAIVDGATLCDEVLADLETLVAARNAETLSLAEAAERTGYSRDHLSRLIRRGSLTNVGRKNKPRLLAQELPVRPHSVAAEAASAYDPNTDARFLRARR